jgi:signal transduction histidine kinase
LIYELFRYDPGERDTDPDRRRSSGRSRRIDGNLRIAQEAMSNAMRHAEPTVISVSLRCDLPNLVLEVTDNGSGIANAEGACREGFGLSNMQARAANLGAQFEVRTAADRGTSIVVRLPASEASDADH